MAISFVGSTATTFTGSASTYSSPDLSGLSIQPNDLLIVTYGCARPNSEGNLALATGLTGIGVGSSTASGTARGVYWRITWARVDTDLAPSFDIPSGGDGRANICIVDVYRGADAGAVLYNTSATNRRPSYTAGGASPAVGHWLWGVGMASGATSAGDHTSLFGETGVTMNGNYRNVAGTESSFCMSTARKPVTEGTADANLGTWSLTDSDAACRQRTFVAELVPVAEFDGDVAVNAALELSGTIGVGMVTEGTDAVGLSGTLIGTGELGYGLPQTRGQGFIRSRGRRVYFDPIDLEPEPKKEKPARRRTPKPSQEPVSVSPDPENRHAPMAPPLLPGADLGEALEAVEAIKAIDRKVRLQREDEILTLLLW